MVRLSVAMAVGMVVVAPFVYVLIPLVVEQRYAFGELPATDRGLERWLNAQPGLHGQNIERAKPDSVILRYAFSRGARPPMPPWKDLGYNKLRSARLSEGIALSGIIKDPLALLLMVLCTQVGFLAVGILWIRRMASRKEPSPALCLRPTLRSMALGVAAGLALTTFGFVYDWVASQFLPPGTNTVGVWAAIRNLPVGWAAAVVVAGTLLAPFCEELFFRGAMLGCALGRGRVGQGVVISSVSFAAAHFDLVNFPAFIVFGAVFAWLYYRSRSLVPCIVAHITNNAIAFGLILN